MSKTYSQIYIHYIFSTKKRQNLILTKYKNRLYGYLRSVGESYGFTVISIGGMPDHLHILIGLPTTITVSKAVQVMKSTSSKWMNDNIYSTRKFGWQKGYGAFSISHSQIKVIIRYLNNQEKHHKKRSFKDEYLSFLKYYNMEFDPKAVFDQSR